MRKVRLEDIFEFIRNGAQIKQFDGAGIPITRIETISNLKIDTNRLGYADIFNDDYQEYYLQNGDLLMSHINSPAHLGKTAIVEQLNKKIIHGMNLLCLRANHQVIPKYIFYYFQTQPFKNALTKIMKKSVNQASISVSDLKKIEITISSYSEQSNSVAILEQLDYQISLRQQQLQTLAQLVKSRFYEMFGDPILNEMRWKKTPLSDVLTIIGGYAFKSKEFLDKGIPILRIGNINLGRIRTDNLVFWKDDPNLRRYKLYPGDLVISLTGTVGKDDYGNICFIDNTFNEYYLNQRNAKLELKNILNKFYLAEILSIPKIKNRLTGISRGVRQANISNKDILQLQIPLPPLALQNQFADFVAEVDKSQLACQKSLDELETLKKSLMQAYFG